MTCDCCGNDITSRYRYRHHFCSHSCKTIYANKARTAARRKGLRVWQTPDYIARWNAVVVGMRYDELMTRLKEVAP